MENTTNMGYNFQALDLLAYIYKKRYIIGIITGIAAVASAIISFVITPKYESSIIFFPATTSSVSKALISNNVFLNKDVLTFGDEEDVEKQLQILYSDEIKNRIVWKYDLFNHYHIKPDSRTKWTQLDNKMKSNIHFRKTQFMSIEVTVLDEDRKTACNIAADIGNFLDTTINRMRKEVAVKAFKIVEHEYASLQNQLDRIQDSIKYIGSMGVYDYEAQSKALNDAYVKALSEGKNDMADKLKRELKKLSEYGAKYISLTELLKRETERFSLLKAKYAEAKVDAEQILPHKFIVTNAFIPEIKAYPKRALIVVVTTVSTFIFSILLLLLIDYFKKLKSSNPS